MKEQGRDAHLFLEGNLDHPADYDGVAFFDNNEYDRLLEEYPDYSKILEDNTARQENGYFISYAKMHKKYGNQLTDKLTKDIFMHDIYELPYEKNVDLITRKWEAFSEKALYEYSPFIFECCFMQNPLTIGLVKYNKSVEEVTNYVLGLAKSIKDLNPLLIYVDQNDLKFSFIKALDERPKAWAESFITYCTEQGYGKSHNHYGVEGTIEVLEAMKLGGKQIYNGLI
ncbi:P-loop NTPase family protein [Oceanobacillus kapialis]|uniref:Uncharacterized protein n=1 Tax=Oceanobacillus kapialis TaxID=481353 RepID=A0ABW5PVM5_9BACI